MKWRILAAVAGILGLAYLVIGNSAYQHTPKLANPKNDAADMAAVLKKQGFQVIEGLDLDKTAFDRKVRDFAAASKGSDSGVFFFAGHGLQVAGQNYLVPIDAKAEGAEALEFEMVRVDVVHRIMERQTNTNILFLDACRDNPLARNLARSMGTRSSEVGRGLAAVESGVGTLISFSTQPGNVALDGTGRNSPFAGALVKQLATSNDDLSAILIGVRNEVMRETQRKQVPWEHSALTGRFYFNPTAQMADPAKVAPARLSEAAEAWGAVKDTTSIPSLEAYVARFKDTFYAELARQRIDELKKQQVAIASPPPTPSVQPGLNGDHSIRLRKDAMKAIGHAVKVPGGMAKGEAPFELAKVRDSLKVIQETAAKAKAFFPDNSRSGDTDALPKAFINKQDIFLRFDRLADTAKAAESAIQDESSFKYEWPKVVSNCGGCHREYRRPR